MELVAKRAASATVTTSEDDANTTRTKLLELFVDTISVAGGGVVALRAIGDGVYERAVSSIGELGDPSSKV